MKAVIQRVRKATVAVEGEVCGRIGQGLVVLLGIPKGDTMMDLHYLVRKITTLRIFSDAQGKMNRSLEEVKGELLLVSQFTLLANTNRGRRPSFEEAAHPQDAQALYQSAITQFRARGITVETGIFGASMILNLENEGPVTILLDSKNQQDRKMLVKKNQSRTDRTLSYVREGED